MTAASTAIYHPGCYVLLLIKVMKFSDCCRDIWKISKERRRKKGEGKEKERRKNGKKHLKWIKRIRKRYQED